MKIKQHLTSLALILFGLQNVDAAPTLPMFSNDTNENWYYIVFTVGQNALTDRGEDINAATAVANSSDDAQLWKLIGNANDFTIKNKKTGRSLYYRDFIKASSTAEAAHFKLTPSKYDGFADSWEIEYGQKGDDYNRWNQWGSTNPNAPIGLYTADNPSNALYFIEADKLPTSVTYTKINEFNISANTAYRPENRHTIWFTNPATAETQCDPWMEYGLPIGNGEFGAMTYGGVAQDHIQFNHKTLWQGDSKTRGCYQNFGDLYIEDISGAFGYTAATAVTNYVRGLDMDEGIAFARYTSPNGTVEYTREYIASNPDNVVAIHLAASEAGKISVRLRLFNGVNQGVLSPTYANGEISFAGKLQYVDFKAKVRPVVTGGSITTNADNLEIKDADEVMILLTGLTNFDQHSPNYLSSKDAMLQTVDSRIDAAASKTWPSILSAHQTDFKSLFSRVDFRIDAAANDRTTKAAVQNYNGRKGKPLDPCNLMIEENYFAIGRYLLIGCSRGVDTPANLQGIWNHTNSPAWQCDIHSNINVQMNYWPAEVTNLSELHMPYLNYIHSMVTEHEQWKEYAQRGGQTEGWTCFTQNNIFGHSDYAENYVVANAWYSYHLWKHYLYTLDKDFLKTRAMPIMVSCAKFWCQRLVKDSDGKWVAPQEWSPEHGPSAENATAHAQQIVNELFKTTLEAINVLGAEAGVDEAFVNELNEKYANLDKGLGIETYDGKWGTVDGVGNGSTLLREWKYSPFSAGEDKHRHQSHLMALFPYDQITPESEYFEPAVNSLKLRGTQSTGWSLAWRIALYARALDGTRAHTVIKTALRHSSVYEQNSSAGGIYYNLLDSHAPFQLDGNAGYTASVSEMLLQTYGGKIRLLPALPATFWVSGHITGLRGEGNFGIDQTWKDGVLSTAKITSDGGLDCNLNYKDIASKATVTDSEGNTVDFTTIDSDNISFPTDKGGIYNITYDVNAGIALVDNESDLQLSLCGSTVSINADNARISVYDIAGCLLTTDEASSVDLSAFAPGAVIVKAETTDRNVVKTFMIR